MKCLKNGKIIDDFPTPDFSKRYILENGSHPPENGFVGFNGKAVTNGYACGYINGCTVNQIGSTGYQANTTAGVIPVTPDDVVTIDQGQYAQIWFYLPKKKS